jgi:hypothetical protein
MPEYNTEWNPDDDDEDIEDEMDSEEDEDDSEDWDEEDLYDAGEFPLTEDTEEDILFRTALIEFGFKFSEYVKEVNPELWKRAIDYAVTFTKVEGVEFHSDPDVKGNTGNEPPTT